MKRLLSFCIALCCISLVSAKVNIGNYEGWEGILDKMNVKESFSMSDYETLYILPVDTTMIVLPQKDDNRYEPTHRLMLKMTQLLSTQLNQVNQEIILINDVSEIKSERALVLKMRLIQFQTGARALRFFGAGAIDTGIRIQGELIDSKSDTKLLTFDHKRTTGFDTRSHEDVLMKWIYLMGEDLNTMFQKLNMQ